MNKTDKLIMDCYRELFANSEPKADFDELMANATINEHGQKEIPFTDYEIKPDKFNEILDKYKNQIKPKRKRQMFENTINLGCSPKFKVHET